MDAMPQSDLPPKQRALHARCVHPSGVFSQFLETEVERSVVERFEQIVEKYPDRIAVKTAEQSLTYKELDSIADRLAGTIVSQEGDRPGAVAILFDSDHQLVAATLGVWKAGKFVTFLDPTFPKARIAAMLENSESSLVIADDRNFSLAMEVCSNKRLLNFAATQVADVPENPRRKLPPDAIACIVYTSGSTGQPKAVILDHRNILYQARLYTHGLHLCAADRIALLTSGTSNAVHTILLTLLNGATLLPFDVRRSGIDHLSEWIEREKMSICTFGSPLFRSLCRSLTGKELFSDLRLIRLRSDTVYKSDFDLYRKHFPRHCFLATGLSSTETGWVRGCFFDHDSDLSGHEVPVGYPVEDKEVWLVDADGRRIGFNEIGEIVVRSRYLSPGYWRRPDLTEAKFKPDPEGSEKRICFTGDLGLMLPDGCLFHKGRADFRVKVRGYSVELREVERRLIDHPGIRETVVIASKDKIGENCLVAYYTSSCDPRPTASELRAFLEKQLPGYMMPAAFVALDKMPLTRNGKLDRNALPAPENPRAQLSTAFIAPRNPTEKTLARIWGEVLGVDQVGVNDNFFELGGHSLSATSVISRVIKFFQLKLPTDALFRSPTVSDMAAVIAHNQDAKASKEDISRILRELDALSEAEAEQILARELDDRNQS